MLFPIKIPQGADALLAQAEAAQQESPVVEAFAQLAGTSTEHIISISLGALFVGVILSVWLCGFSVVQTYFYFSFSSVNDKKSLKLFVLFVFLVDLSDSILSVSWLWSYLIANYGNIGYALTASGPFSATPALEGVIFVCCTGFFLRRIWALTGNLPLFLFIAILATVSFGANLATVVFIDQARNSLDSFGDVRVSASVWLIFSILSDTMVSATLIWFLKRAMTGFTATDAILTKLTRAMLHTGLLTTIVTLCAMTIFLSNSTPLGLSFVPFLLVLPKLRFNSLMATLNGRRMGSGSSSNRKTGTEATLLPTMISSTTMMASRPSLSRISLSSRTSERINELFSPITMGRSNSRASENNRNSTAQFSLPTRASSRASQRTERSRTSQKTQQAQGFDLVSHGNSVTLSNNPPSSRKNLSITRRMKRSHSDPQAPTASILKAREQDLSEDIQIFGSAAILDDSKGGGEGPYPEMSYASSSSISISNIIPTSSTAAQYKKLPALSIQDQRILDDPRFPPSARNATGATFNLPPPGSKSSNNSPSSSSNSPYTFNSSPQAYSNSPSSSSANLLNSSEATALGAGMERDSRFRVSTSTSIGSSSAASGRASLSRDRLTHPEVFSIHSSRSRT